jgi:hypothetical protein
MSHSNSKATRGQAANPPSNDLTCSEGQIEDLLSQGESTEVETEEEEISGKPASTNAPGQQPT